MHGGAFSQCKRPGTLPRHLDNNREWDCMAVHAAFTIHQVSAALHRTDVADLPPAAVIKDSRSREANTMERQRSIPSPCPC